MKSDWHLQFLPGKMNGTRHIVSSKRRTVQGSINIRKNFEREGVLFVCSILGYECKREKTVQHGMIKGLLRGSPGPVLLHSTMK